jgi:hypothetical protein
MARFFGKVGYATSVETAPSVWSDGIVERDLYGNVLNESASSEESDKVNDDKRLSSRISVIADPFELGHYRNIVYIVDEGGVYWKVTSRELKKPRLILSTGGVYTGPKP